MCFFTVRGKNLAPEGKAYLSDKRKNNATYVIDGNTSKQYSTTSCLKEYFLHKLAWWKVDFDDKIKVYAVEITPGKLKILQEGKRFISKCKWIMAILINALEAIVKSE